MATRYAINDGNQSDAAIWSLTSNGAGGASVPGPGDTADLNGHNITLDQAVWTVAIIDGTAIGTASLVVPHATSRVVNANMADQANIYTVLADATCALTWNGNWVGGTWRNTGGILNLNGDMTDLFAGYNAVECKGAGLPPAAPVVVNIVGDVIGELDGFSLLDADSSGARINVVGNVTNTGAGGNGILSGNFALISVIGDVTNTGAGGVAVKATSSGIAQVLGNAINTSATGYAVQNALGEAVTYISGDIDGGPGWAYDGAGNTILITENASVISGLFDNAGIWFHFGTPASVPVLSSGIGAPAFNFDLPEKDRVRAGTTFFAMNMQQDPLFTGTGSALAFGPFPVQPTAIGPFPAEDDSLGPYPVVSP